MKRHALLLLTLGGLMAFPLTASANAGTPLMWASMLHLAFGNLLIGLLEGGLLAGFFGRPKARPIVTMIGANYFSAWIGGLFLRGAIVAVLPLDLFNAWRWFWIMAIGTYGMTVLLEWPFVAWCFRGEPDRWRRSLRASWVIQSVSYVLLFGWYWLASGTSLYTHMKVVAPAEMTRPAAVTVYYIAPEDGNVYQRLLAGGEPQQVCELNSKDENDRLFVRPNPIETNHWDLVARLETSNRQERRLVSVLTNLAVAAVADWRSTHTDPPRYDGTWFTFGEVPKLGDATNRPWNAWCGFWPVEGLRAWKTNSAAVRFSWETPFGQWPVRNAVLLPGDLILFQLGRDQICGFDPEAKSVTLFWHGRGPVAVRQSAAPKHP